MSENDKDEFRNAIRQIGYYSMNLENPYDRVRVSEWVRKLIAIDDDCSENVKKKNEYIQFLRIQVTQALLIPPFTKPPPDTELPPLPELLVGIHHKKCFFSIVQNDVKGMIATIPVHMALQLCHSSLENKVNTGIEIRSQFPRTGNIICKKIPGLPKPGPITPSVIHRSPDGRAYISIKHVPGDGILCYMAVTPDPTELE